MPKANLSVTFNFSASHFLTNYHGKCENLHGHNYKLIVMVSGLVKEDGIVMDFVEIKKIVSENVLLKLDHVHLNDVAENPSCENVVIWIWEKLKDKLPLKKLSLYETENYCCEYEGE